MTAPLPAFGRMEMERPPDRSQEAIEADPDRTHVSALDALDGLVEEAKRRRHWEAYEFARAYAHNLGFHLTSCTGGKRVHSDRAARHPEGHDA